MSNQIYHRKISDLGPLRIAIVAAGAMLALIAPLAGGHYDKESLAALPNLIAPPLAVMMAFVFPLDILMSLVFRADADAIERARLNFVIQCELAAFVILVVSWAPFFGPLLSR